jgi:hypothetical protein
VGDAGAEGWPVVGYVSLALDHDHIREFTDHLSPTDSRYTAINDAIVGNYAFMWDHRSRNISHPRDYFIVGYDPATGEQVTPWLDQGLYDAWQASGKPSGAFLAGVTPFDGQSLKKKPAAAQVKAGTVALDCRYLNFSPQCAGWNQLTERAARGLCDLLLGPGQAHHRRGDPLLHRPVRLLAAGLRLRHDRRQRG